MALGSKHLTGILIGVGVSAVGFYVYKKNQNKIDDWLRRQGINVPRSSNKNDSDLSLEELVTEKERLEDQIAERQHAAQEGPAPAAG